MDITTLIFGCLLLGVFTWLLVRNLTRKGGVAIFHRMDIVIGILVAVYLVINSMEAILR